NDGKLSRSVLESSGGGDSFTDFNYCAKSNPKCVQQWDRELRSSAKAGQSARSKKERGGT
ncbi:hypothetical protein QUA56_31265, partial [Microcoleus sp. N3A4]